ncbi:hypothetical protein HanPI659440_Chr02g0085591 [Helianthus annuus]|nr:hypothetical protein HanPI659440_Chr02g0085591 [Helianthus annuus]
MNSSIVLYAHRSKNVARSSGDCTHAAAAAPHAAVATAPHACLSRSTTLDARSSGCAAALHTRLSSSVALHARTPQQCLTQRQRLHARGCTACTPQQQRRTQQQLKSPILSSRS